MTTWRLRDFEQCSNCLQFYLLLLWSMFHVNWYTQWLDMNPQRLCEWYWEMFKPTPTWHNSLFVNLVCELGQIMIRYDFIILICPSLDSFILKYIKSCMSFGCDYSYSSARRVSKLSQGLSMHIQNMTKEQLNN